MKKFIAILTVFFTLSVSAQINDDEVYFYIEAGQELKSSTKIQIIKCDGDILKIASESMSKVSEKLAKSEDFYNEYFLNNGTKWKYNSSMSTSSKEVYQSSWTSGPNLVQTGQFSCDWVYTKIGMYYRAISTNKESMISWREKDNSSDILDKTYWKRIERKDLKPKSVNRDFLYE